LVDDKVKVYYCKQIFFYMIKLPQEKIINSQFAVEIIYIFKGDNPADFILFYWLSPLAFFSFRCLALVLIFIF